MSTRIRAHDWRKSGLQLSLTSWTAPLTCAVQLMLDSAEPCCILWGPEGICLYNDAYVSLLAHRHPDALGQPFFTIWPRTASTSAMRFATVLASGHAAVIDEQPFITHLNGYAQEAYFHISAIPIRDVAAGTVEGVLQQLADVSARVNRDRYLRNVEARLGEHHASRAFQLALADAINDDRERQRLAALVELEDREERLRLALVAGRLAMWDWDLLSGTVVWSEQMYSMHGYHVHEVQPSFGAWAQRVQPDDLGQFLQDLEAAMHNRREFTLRVRILLPDGDIRWCVTRGSHFFNAAGRAIRLVAIVQDVTDELAAEQRLQRSESRQRALIEGVPQLLWSASNRGAWQWCSPQWTRYTGLSVPESLEFGWLRAVHADDRQRVLSAWQHAGETENFDVEHRLSTPQGTFRWFKSRATALRSSESGTIEWFGTSTDIDDIRQAQDIERLLVAELQHRTRNLLGIVRSVSVLTAQDCPTLNEYQMQFGARLAALSRVQGLISRAGQPALTLRDLIWLELHALAPGLEDRCAVSGPEVRLDSSVVQAIALALHELATNAVKHGSLGSREGWLHVEWSTSQDAEGKLRLQLHWRETHPGHPPDVLMTSGYGRELLERMLPYTLGANTSFSVELQGIRCSIDFPVSLDKATQGLRVTRAS